MLWVEQIHIHKFSNNIKGQQYQLLSIGKKKGDERIFLQLDLSNTITLTLQKVFCDHSSSRI